MKVAVLLTCHNRRVKTLHCLESLHSQVVPSGLVLEVWLVDDGSTDGTEAAIRSQFPAVHIIRGNGQLFWCRGMRLAWQTAAAGEPDVYLWLNDDVALRPGALVALAKAAAAHPDALIIGSCADPTTGRRTYGGLQRLGAHPAKLAAVEPTDRVIPCSTFEGNIVWVPRAAFARLGPLRMFQHAMGDIDYGYRAARAGFTQLIAPGFLGTCALNSKERTWEDAGLPRLIRLRKLKSVKGLPPADWWRLCLGHGGWRAPLYFLGPWARIVAGR